jgi:esterase/lipase superfamily enzyme
VKEEYIRWNTPCLGGRVFEMLVFGHGGFPVILFPTCQGRYYEHQDFRLVEAAAPLLDAKGISHWLDVWRWAKHDWPPWWDMFPRYLSKL